MSPLESQIHAINATFASLQAQLEALLMAVAGHQVPSQAKDPAETCPHCGASGETQAPSSSLADGPTRKVTCLVCKQERVL